MANVVPNQLPSIDPGDARIALIGEAPAKHEVDKGLPFVGASGHLLWEVAAKHGILREKCLVANVSQHRAPEDNINLLPWDGPEIQGGLAALAQDLQVFRPNICVLLGNKPLRAFTGETSGISNWRGSLLRRLFGGHMYKCIPTLHPAGILREYIGKTLLKHDLGVARAECRTPTLTLPQRNLRASLPYEQLIAELDYIIALRPLIAFDIEGYWSNITCISIATTPFDCFVLHFHGWTEAQEAQLLLRLACILGDAKIPKILQNALYDTFCLQYGYSIPVRNVVDDTMLSHWELYSEMPKKLSFQASIYTREPYYKDEREHEDIRTRLLYCAKDSAVTFEVRNVMTNIMTPEARNHYAFNIAMLEPLRYMELYGMRYDVAKAKVKAAWCRKHINRLQWALNEIAGIDQPKTAAGWFDMCREMFCFKRMSSRVCLNRDLITYAKKDFIGKAGRAIEILSKPELTIEDIGELSILTKLCCNVESSDQIADYLYRTLGLPVQFKKEGGKKTDKETTDVLALLTLYKKTNDPTLKLILKIRSLRTRLEVLEAIADPDGRIRCGYNVVGTVTGRLSCYQSPTGSGFNLQTATKKDRDLFLPDSDEFWFFQCDLSGADGWTVAAHCAARGDSTMLDDYRYGLKPAKIIALMYLHGKQVLEWSREQIKTASKAIDSDGWLYFACKRVQHGSNYGMKKQTMSDQILKDSFKLFGEPIYVAPNMCETLQRLYLTRYRGIELWHRHIKHQLLTHGYLISANGHKRIFFDRRDDYETFKAACSEEPQQNTTFATNKALLNLWTDPSNRVDWRIDTRTGQHNEAFRDTCRRRTTLRVQPLHQIHDALCGQFRKTDTLWATQKINTWFNNELLIAGQRIVIPFEGAYGTSWGNLKEGVI